MSLLTIDDYRQQYAGGNVSPADELHRLWQEFDAHGCGPLGDTAIIYLPTAAQRAQLLEHLSRFDPDQCPLWGIPFVVKDNIDISGWPTTAGCPEFAYTADSHASVVQALIDAGAIPVAKANLDQFATGLVGTRSPFGWVRNTFSDAHISGGSSSGSASVVARGLVPFALGTDTAGSGRIPAGFNNLVGIKPTPGRFSTEGVVPACKTVDCVSVFSLTVSDGAVVSGVLSATGDAVDEPRFHPQPRTPRFAFAKHLRVGVPKDPFFMDTDYQALYEQVLDSLSSEWEIELMPIDMAALDAVAQQLYSGPWIAERFITAQDCLARDVPGLDPTVKAIVSKGKGFSACDAFAALYEVRQQAVHAARIWQDVDVLLVPTAPGLPRYADVQADPVGVNSALGRYTNFVNLLGWCALSVPAGFTPKGLPFGVTWIAQADCDEALLALGTRWAQWQGESLSQPKPQPLGCHLREARPPSHAYSARPAGAHPVAVVGAHLSGMPLNSQLQAAGARLSQVTTTSAAYALYHIPDTTPPKPGLVRIGEGGQQIALEVYDVPAWAISDFLANIPSPLGLGKVELASGQWVTGFICEPSAKVGAKNISAYGGWRAYMEAIKT